jgi:hypothetical protein
MAEWSTPPRGRVTAPAPKDEARDSMFRLQNEAARRYHVNPYRDEEARFGPQVRAWQEKLRKSGKRSGGSSR